MNDNTQGIESIAAPPAAESIASEFFREYARALLDRDAAAVARLYAVPALILFPGQSIAVSDLAQTEEFFASAWPQYDGITDTRTAFDIVAESADSIWVDLTWRHDNDTTERLMYQLARTGDEWRIAVLTPLG